MIKKIYLYINKDVSEMGKFLAELFDLVLLGLVAIHFGEKILLGTLHLYTALYNHYYGIYNLEGVVSMMVEPQVNTTTTTILHSNDGWAQGIKSLYIYGFGAFQLHLMRGGTPLLRPQRGFILASTIAADAGSTALKNAINDPEYVEKHWNSWKRILGTDKTSVSIDVSQDSETLSKLKEVKQNYLPDNFNGFKEDLLNSIIEYLKPILEPVSVDYSNEILANQIYVISIMLFILSLMIMLLIIGLLVNTVIFVYSDRLKDLFTNKFIRGYITLNKKFIGLEIFIVGANILYFMYSLTYGLHFIATHRILI